MACFYLVIFEPSTLSVSPFLICTLRIFAINLDYQALLPLKSPAQTSFLVTALQAVSIVFSLPLVHHTLTYSSKPLTLEYQSAALPDHTSTHAGSCSQQVFLGG